jgi:hypothetical protein
MADQRELTGWGEIAKHLGVSVRTAQAYEREFGLPVHRKPGSKGRVWAVPDELDQWKQGGAGESYRQRHLTNEPEQATSSGLAGSRPRPRGPLLWLLVAGSTVVLVGLAAGIKYLHNLARRPASWRVAGNTLSVLGEDGSELWHHAFPAPMEEGAYVSRSPVNCLFADVDGDGRMETIFSYHSWDPATRRLVCFNRNGTLRWQFLPGKSVRDNRGREFPPPYWPATFAVVRAKGSDARIVVSSNHHWSFPDQVAVLDGRTGRLLSEYWHRGHLPHMALADLDNSGRPEVLLGGVNDAPEYSQATLVVFDDRKIAGASCDPRGAVDFQGMAPGTEKHIIFFPRSLISQNEEFNRVVDVRVASAGITVFRRRGEIGAAGCL